MVNRNLCSISYRLRVICDFYDLFSYIGNDVVRLSPLVASKVKFYKRFRKATTDFLLVVNNIFWPITHRFRVISDFSDFGDKPEVT